MMLIWIWTRDDETGLLDDEFRDGDPLQTKLDSFEPSIGTSEKKSWLIIKIPDPPLTEKFMADFERAEYTPSQTQGEENIIRRKRIYRLPWRNKFTAAEIDVIEDGNAMLPDGQTSQGGTVVSGVVSGLFTVSDFVRK
jgi:hypothetical protein